MPRWPHQRAEGLPHAAAELPAQQPTAHGGGAGTRPAGPAAPVTPAAGTALARRQRSFPASWGARPTTGGSSGSAAERRPRGGGPPRREPGALQRERGGPATPRPAPRRALLAPAAAPQPGCRALTAEEGAEGEALLLVPLEETPEGPEHPARPAGPSPPRVGGRGGGRGPARGAPPPGPPETPPALRRCRPWRRRRRRWPWPGWTRPSTWSVREGIGALPPIPRP